ncbi:alpha/beta hydrolase [Cryptosporangium sp. NPDC048952]|uniref:alpha/beta hydrolase n=1 Tax=Cryptosporangium sp. NPDC048952 TaxID=3363961 RepID=UPI003710F956
MLKSRRPLIVVLVLIVVVCAVWGREAVIRLAISGSHPFELDRFYRQDVSWHGCRERLDEVGARCADITVPLDYDRPRGRTLTLTVTRRLGTDSDHHQGTLVIDTGNAGNGVLAVLQGLTPVMSHGSPTVAARYDLVSVSGRSAKLDCGWPAVAPAAAPDRRSFEASVATAKDLASRCANVKDLLPYVSTRVNAQDVDVVRSALLTDRVSYLGWSYGGYLGAVYAQMFPEHVRRVVLDSALDPAAAPSGKPDAAALANWARWAAERDATYHLGASEDQVLAGVKQTPPGLLRIDVDTDEAYAAFTARVQARTGAEGPTAGEVAVRCADRPVSKDPETYYRDIQTHLRDEPLFGPLERNVTPCAFWPAEPAKGPVRIGSNVPALLVGASGDPVGGQQGIHRALTRSRLVTLDGAFRHRVYLFDGNKCVDKAVDDYLLAGTLPSTDQTCTRS